MKVSPGMEDPGPVRFVELRLPIRGTLPGEYPQEQVTSTSGCGRTAEPDTGRCTG